MKCFAGEWRRDGSPVDASSIRAMLVEVPWYGGDGEGCWCSSSIGLGALQNHDTPESRFESAITSYHDGQYLLAGNFRIDNRDELIAKLDIIESSGRPITDADLILAAYGEWGSDCPSRLIGDFAFALWDGAIKQLLLVRDHIGIAPLYYYRTPWGLIFASDLRALAAHPEGPKELNPSAIIHHLRDVSYDLPETTYLKGVRKLKPAHMLRPGHEYYKEVKYWFPEKIKPIVYADHTSYAAELKQLFSQAVACRLRSLHPIGAHLSGGLDSTAIAFEAQRQLAEQGAALAGAYNWFPDWRAERTLGIPEYQPALLAEKLLGVSVEGVDLTPQILLREIQRDIRLEGYCGMWYESLVREKAKAKGIKTLLSGWGGDDVVSSGLRGYSGELFWQGRWVTLTRILLRRTIWKPRDSKANAGFTFKNLKELYKLLKIFVVEPSLPKPLYQMLRIRNNKNINYKIQALSFLGELPELPPLPDRQQCIGKQAAMVQEVYWGLLQARIENWAAQGAMDGIQYLYPLLDKRLIEFSLAVPARLYIDEQGEGRNLFKTAVKHVIPSQLVALNAKHEPHRVAIFLDLYKRLLQQYAPDGTTIPDTLHECILLARWLFVISPMQQNTSNKSHLNS